MTHPARDVPSTSTKPDGPRIMDLPRPSFKTLIVGSTTMWNIIGLVAAITILYIILGSVATGFLNQANQLGLLRDAATIGVTAGAMTLVIIAGEIDVSIGPAVAFASVLFATGVSEWGLPPIVAILVTLTLGACWGSIAGLLRARWAVPSFIATLGLWSVLRGFGQYMTNALPVSFAPNSLTEVLGGTILGVPTPAWVMFVVFAVFIFIARKTAYGRSVYAVGGNADAARLAGINIVKVRIILFASTGLMAAVSGVLLAARLNSGNSGAAMGLEFDVIAAVVIGGTAMTGGRGSLIGSLLGVLFITLIANGLVLLGVNSFLQDVVRGVIIVGAVLLNVTMSRRTTLSAKKKA